MIRVLLNLKIAVRSLMAFKVRTALAMLGVFLGTFSLIVVSNLSGSLSKKTLMELESFGKNLLVVRSGIVRKFGRTPRLLSEATTLKPSDARAISDSSRFVRDVSPSDSKAFPIRYRETVLASVQVAGVMPNYQEIRSLNTAQGRFISRQDNEDMGKVAVLGSTVVEKLFGGDNPLGKYILIYRAPTQVIGVMEPKGADTSGVDQDNQVFVPLNTFMRRIVNRDNINSIYVQAISEGAMPGATLEIEGILRQRHAIGEGKRDDFTVIDMKDFAKLKTEAMSTITILGRIASAISFLIGGIGILSIMILVVNERKVEIGLRRAVGSRKRDIILQFLMEASFVALSGGMVGVLAGLFTSVAIFSVSSLPLVLSPLGFVLSFLASVTVGILAGIYPSKKATTFQPIDVLRAS